MPLVKSEPGGGGVQSQSDGQPATPPAPPSPGTAANADGPIRSGRSSAIPASTPNRSPAAWPCCYTAASPARARLCATWMGCCAISGGPCGPTLKPSPIGRRGRRSTKTSPRGIRGCATGAWSMAGALRLTPDFYDVKVAGWWVWGLSNWIGGGWCAVHLSISAPHAGPTGRRPGAAGRMPKVHNLDKASRRSGARCRRFNRIAAASASRRSGAGRGSQRPARWW